MQLRLSKIEGGWHNKKMSVMRGGFFIRNTAFSQPALYHTGKRIELTYKGYGPDTAMCCNPSFAHFVLGADHYYGYN